MTSRLIFSPKKLSETCFTSPPFDFISSLGVAETISTQVVTVSVYSGTDPEPASMLSGGTVGAAGAASGLTIMCSGGIGGSGGGGGGGSALTTGTASASGAGGSGLVVVITTY